MIHILLADDQDLLCEILKTSLEQQPDFQVIGRANNGKEALEKIDRFRPDIALIDINMPIMDGLTATEKIVHNFPETKVIVLSGSEGESDRINAINAGAKSYIPKTAKAIEIVEQIRTVYQESFATKSEPELRETIMQLNQAKREIHDYLQHMQQKLDRVEHTEAEIQKYFGQLTIEQQELSEEMFGFKSDIESIVNDIRKTVKESNSHSTEINKLQNLLEGQLSYIHNLNKRFNSLRKYSLIASGIAGLALLVSLINVITS
jgi:DNA-binding NarL/FixJ family response regulator